MNKAWDQEDDDEEEEESSVVPKDNYYKKPKQTKRPNAQKFKDIMKNEAAFPTLDNKLEEETPEGDQEQQAEAEVEAEAE